MFEGWYININILHTECPFCSPWWQAAWGRSAGPPDGCSSLRSCWCARDNEAQIDGVDQTWVPADRYPPPHWISSAPPHFHPAGSYLIINRQLHAYYFICAASKKKSLNSLFKYGGTTYNRVYNSVSTGHVPWCPASCIQELCLRFDHCIIVRNVLQDRHWGEKRICNFVQFVPQATDSSLLEIWMIVFSALLRDTVM